MLASILFAVLAAGQLALVCRCVVRFRATRDRLLIVPAGVCAALSYDNAILAAGRWIGVGETLETLSVPRFVLHLLLTPLLMPWARAVAARAGVGWAGTVAARAVVAAVTAAVIALGVLGELVRLSLRPEQWAGTVRYTTEHIALAGLLSPVVTVLVMLVAAGSVWRVRGYRFWTLTTVTMTLVSAAMPPMLLTNCAELLFVVGVVATAVRFPVSRVPAAGPAARAGRAGRR